MAEEKTKEQLQQELDAANKVIDQQNEVVSDLKGKLKAEKSQKKIGFPRVKIDNVDYDITIQIAKFRDGDEDKIITAKDIQENEELAKKLLEIKFGGLRKVEPKK